MVTLIVCDALVALVVSVTVGAAEYSFVTPAWLNVTVQVPVPLVIVIVALADPLPLHEPEPAMVTGFPLAPPVAATGKVLL